jgi:acetyl esterase/lipase
MHEKKFVLYLHGGGGALCSSKTHRVVTHGIAVAADAVLVVPNYRRVPEHCLTHALEDSVAVYTYLIEELGIDAKNVSIAGDSAGGALAVLALCKIRDKGLPIPASGLLLSPWCDVTAVPATSAPVDYITREALEFMQSMLVSEGKDLTLVNPSAQLLENLPPLLIQYGDSELLAEQIRVFAKQCQNADIQVELMEYHEMVHIPHFFSFLSREGHRAVLDLAQFLTTGSSVNRD